MSGTRYLAALDAACRRRAQCFGVRIDKQHRVYIVVVPRADKTRVICSERVMDGEAWNDTAARVLAQHYGA